MIANAPTPEIEDVKFNDGLEGHDTGTDVMIISFLNGSIVTLYGADAKSMFYGFTSGFFPLRGFNAVKENK